MSELKICRICLRTEAKCYKYDRYQLKSFYEEVTAVKVEEEDSLPHYFCYECAMMLHKFHKFKEKCYCGQKALREILWRGAITYESVYKVDRVSRKLNSPLVVMPEMISFSTKETSHTTQDSDLEPDEIKDEEKNNCATNLDEDSFDVEIEPIFEENKPTNPESPSKLIEISIEAENFDVNKSERQKIKGRRREGKIEDTPKSTDMVKYVRVRKRRKRCLDANHWRQHTLTEEEAVKEFRARSEDPKYLKAAFKCADCFRGFSKQEMLLRHLQLRHSESLGTFECRFCRTRFKWDSLMRVHMRQHFIKYQCLRCRFVCPLENTALFHEEYHSGVVRKCLHCGDEFRHSSTYYTHLRTLHRSEFVCTVCGVSFVSEAGLHQHKKIKHVTNDIDSPDDDEDVQTYCERCDIRFETRKAYEEHVFHSVRHTEGVEDEIKDEITIPRKIHGKKLRAKVTNNLRRRVPEDQPDQPKAKRYKRVRRRRRKPTSCHQCGKHFDTQSECMKHHLAEHPRTSFYSPTERYICEICGASLAPGSVAAHQNMHTKKVMHSCDTCGRQFHSSVSIKRHQLTHTGEKPFACSLCDKRFTQSNSMKLHYRTFHLKQPYPKRNRRKKAPDTENAEVENSASDELQSEDSLPEPDTEPMPDEPVPNVGPAPEIKATAAAAMPDMTDDTIHYLTLT